jgi:iron(III) transport system permease protein
VTTTSLQPSSAPATTPPPSTRAPRRRRHQRPVGLYVASALVAAALVMPLAYLVLEADGAGLGSVVHLLWRPLTRTLLWNTVRLTVVVTALCALIGTLAAWCVERTDLPGRRWWAVLVVVPFAIPDFVVSFAWSSLSTWVEGFQGAVLVMTLAVYPLVYLPVAASLRSSDPALEEVARSLGVGRVQTFLRVTLGQVRGAILGGSVLVALVLLAEYGAFEILRYQTFTTEIFTELGVSFSVPTMCALCFVLVALGIVVLGIDAASRGKGRDARTGSFAQRTHRRHRLGRATLPVLCAFALLVAAALGLPIAACVYWIVQGGIPGIGGVSLSDATWNTAMYSGSAALVATAAAVPVALLAVRHPSRASRLLERTTFIVLAVPGVVIAFALSYFSERYLAGFEYQSAPMLVLAYAILFFPLALVGVRAAVAHASVRAEEASRSLGLGPLATFRRVTFPLVAPGIAAAFCLVFLAAVTELTATLLLHPNGVQTLATQFWGYEQNFSYAQAAPFALVIIGIAAIPSYVLGRYFDRLPTRARPAA